MAQGGTDGYSPTGEGLPASGQPLPYQPGEVTIAKKYPRLFGMGYRELAGVPKVITVNQPPVATDWTYTHGGPSWLLIRSLCATLTTSSSTGSRLVTINVKYSGTLVGAFAANNTQAASLVYTYCASDAYAVAGDANAINVCLPTEYILKDAMSIGSYTPAILTGDQWSAIAIYAEEFTDRCLDL